VPLGKLDEALVSQFHEDRSTIDHQRMRRGSASTTRQLLEYLRRLGCTPMPPVTVASTAVDVLLGDFERFLSSERGLSPATLKNYLPVVQHFLVERPDNASPLGELRATDIHGFILRHAQRGSLGRTKLVVTALRPQRSRKRTHVCSRKVTQRVRMGLWSVSLRSR